MTEMQTHEVARRLFGDPSSATPKEWRWNRRGSFKVTLANGLWCDHETGEGGDVIDLVRRELRCGFFDALDYIGRPRPEHDEDQAEPREDLKPDPQQDLRARRNMRSAKQIWESSEPPEGTLVETYLVSRGLLLPEDEPSGVLRFHPACPFKGKQHPAMVALMRDPETGAGCGVHRTALTPEGAKLDRAMLGRAGAIMLSDSADVSTGLGVSEGIENALAVLQSGWAPVWALGSAGAIAGFPVLPGIECLTIFADHDRVNRRTRKRAGLIAAHDCAERWSAAGREVFVRYPSIEGSDWNDLRRAA